MNIKLVTQAELVNILLAVPSQTFISLVSVTEPDLKAKDANKNPNPYMLGRTLADGFDLAKVNKASGTIEYDFDRMVLNRNKKAIIEARIEQGLAPLDEAELTAVASARHEKGETWYQWVYVDGRRTCLVKNKKAIDDPNAKLYLGFVYRSVGSPQFFTLGGEVVATELIRPFESVRKVAENQGLAAEDVVRVVTFELPHIIEIAVGGSRYRVSDTLTSMSQTLRHHVWDIAEQYIGGELRMRNVNG
jgi:hypothetical protein